MTAPTSRVIRSEGRYQKPLCEMCLQDLQAEGGQGYVPVDPVPAVLARLIARSPDRLLPHMHFEGDFCLNCDWRRIDLEASSRAR